MKNIKYILVCFILVLFFACEKDLMTYHGGNRIEFTGDTLVQKTFVFDDADVQKDTIWLKVQSLGHLSKEDRPFQVVQLTEKHWTFTYDDEGNKTDSSYVAIDNGAVEGQHFVSLSYPSIQEKFVLKADSVVSSFPIVLLRDESLKSGSYRLRVKLVANEFFDEGELIEMERVIVFTDKFVKPSLWDGYFDYFFGQYGPVKHKFMYDVTGIIIDDDFLAEVRNDSSLREHYVGLFRAKLKEYNANNPDNPLREEPEEGQDEGRLVSFG